MKHLSLGSDSNLPYAISVGIFAFIVCFTSLLAYKSYRMIRQGKPEVEPDTFWGMLKHKALGTGPNAIAMMMLWSILAILSLWALFVVVLDEGFIEASYDSSHVELQYRLWSDPIDIPWREIKDIQFLQRTTSKYKMNWRIRITVLGGDVYESITCSKKTDQRFDLMNEAASELQRKWTSNRE